MNNNINIAEILKDCPKGTKLYSTIFGEVEFGGIKNDSIYPVIIKSKDYGVDRLSIDGKRFVNCGECVLFPSKDQRDWSKFKAKEEAFVPPCKFKDGDIVAVNLGSQVFILKRREDNRIGYCYVGYDFEHNKLFPTGAYYFSRLATEEEKQKFFDAIKKN